MPGRALYTGHALLINALQLGLIWKPSFICGFVQVHVVTYEGMRKDLKALLPGIAAFLEVTLTDELSATVMELR